MKDTKKPLRIAIFNALTGNITYDSVSVPVVDEKVRNTTTSNLFIVLGTQQESNEENNDSCFITRSSIDIEIIHKTGTEVSKDAMDDVYEDMMEIIFPTTQTIGITVTSGFQFQNGFRESSVSQLIQLSETESIITQRVRLTFIIVQK